MLVEGLVLVVRSVLIGIVVAAVGWLGPPSARAADVFQFHLLVPEEITRHVEGVR